MSEWNAWSLPQVYVCTLSLFPEHVLSFLAASHPAPAPYPETPLSVFLMNPCPVAASHLGLPWVHALGLTHVCKVPSGIGLTAAISHGNVRPQVSKLSPLPHPRSTLFLLLDSCRRRPRKPRRLPLPKAGHTPNPGRIFQGGLLLPRRGWTPRSPTRLLPSLNWDEGVTRSCTWMTNISPRGGILLHPPPTPNWPLSWV